MAYSIICVERIVWRCSTVEKKIARFAVLVLRRSLSLVPRIQARSNRLRSSTFTKFLDRKMKQMLLFARSSVCDDVD